MLKTKQSKLEKAMIKKEPLNNVRTLFLEYCREYKVIRNPTRQDFKEYERTYILYIHYLDGLKEKLK